MIVNVMRYFGYNYICFATKYRKKDSICITSDKYLEMRSFSKKNAYFLKVHTIFRNHDYYLHLCKIIKCNSTSFAIKRKEKRNASNFYAENIPRKVQIFQIFVRLLIV